MKKIVLLMVFSLSLMTLSAQEINWVSIEEAQELQKKEPRKILIDMYTVWCGPCKRMDRDTFGNADVIEYVNTHYYAVKFNAEGDGDVVYNGKTYSNPNYNPAKARTRNYPHQLTQAFGVRAYPTIVFINEAGQLIAPIRSYKTPQQLELYLKMFKNDDHKQMTSQEAFNEYYELFKPEFKSQ